MRRNIPTSFIYIFISIILALQLGISKVGEAQNTDLLSPTSNTNINSVTNPGYAYSSDNQYAVFDTYNDAVRFEGFNISIPTDATVVGIEVQLEGNVQTDRDLNISLTWNGGTGYTSEQTMTRFGTSDATRTVGARFDTWGHTWSVSELSNSNFGVRCRVPQLAYDDLYLDHVQIQVYYIVQGQVFTASSSSTFTVPSGVTCIKVECWGGGGRGGSTSNSGTECGGGGGGAYARSVLSVTPGSQYSLSVGAGSATTYPGGDTYFINASTVMAKGGNSVANNTLTGASGGSADSSIGEAKHSGGNGASGSNDNYGGGGGSSAGSSSNGTNATSALGASAPSAGGNGGSGSTSIGDGNAGYAPGGGGGGVMSGKKGGQTGGAGADGLVIISWGSISSTNVPTVSSPINNGATSISGTSEANASIVVYAGTIQIGTATANSSGIWTATVSVVSTGQSITATAKAIDKCISGASSAVTVTPITSITTGTISPASFCPGAAVNVPYTITGTFNSGNTFTAQLSNSSGSFSSPTSIGSLTSTSSGTIAVTIPSGQATGTGYRIRVVSSSPSVTGSDNGANITVGAPTITKIFSGANCGPGTVTLGATASSGTIHWYSSSTGGSAIASGTTFTTPSLASNTTYYVDATDGACTSSPRVPVTASIITPPSITAGGGGSYCTGSTINLTSSSAHITNQYWTGPNSYYSLNANPTITGSTTANTGTYTVTGSALSGVNLLTNGDFSAGNTDFTTQYTLAAQTASGLNPEGTFDVVALPSSRHSNFCSCGDHTSGAGLQMVINGAGAEVVVWSQTVNVVPNTAYQFTYWLQTVVNNDDPSPSKLQLFVNEQEAGPIYTANKTTGVWTQFTYNWNSGSATTAVLALKNENFTAGGNDFALDDIVFQQACQATASINVSVSASFTPGVSITASANLACAGSTVTFTATPTNGGSSPSYQWKLNGSNVGTNSPTYTNSSLVTGDKVSCVMTSNLGCVSPSTATSSTVTMTITSPPTATISYSDTPFCKSLSSAQPVTLSGTGAYMGGTYSSTLGLTINSATGAITPGTSTAGTYTVTYTTPVSGGCSAVSATTSVTITALPVATFSYTGSPYCSNASNPSPTFSGGGVAGTFSSTAGLNFVSTATGQINLATSTPGTYTVTNTIAAAGGCEDVTATTSVKIYANLTASISGGTSPICYNTSPGTLTATGNGGTGTYTYLWYKDGVSTGVTTQNYTPGNLTATSDFYCAVTSGSCGTVNTSTTTITVDPNNTITLTSGAGSDNQTVCLGTAISTITYSTTGASGASLSGLPPGVSGSWASGMVTISGTPTTLGTYSYTVTLTGGCGTASANGTITIKPLVHANKIIKL